MMKIQISQLLNTSILNSEWVGFHGDSEYLDGDGNLHFGYWTFVGITDDPKGEVPFGLDDEIDEEALYGEFIVLVRNKKDHICMVAFGYRR